MVDDASRYELVKKEFGRCNKCGRLADVVSLMSLIGDNQVVSQWSKCAHCSRPEFRLPQTREEAFRWWKSRKARNDVARARQGRGTPYAFKIVRGESPCKHCGEVASCVTLLPKAAFGKPVAGWFKCSSCSSPEYGLPATLEEAFDRWQKKLARREKNPSSYELVEEEITCAQRTHNAHKAAVFRLRPRGGGMPVASWFFCDQCSPSSFYPPEDAEDAYQRWQKRQAKRFGGRVVDTFTPSAA